MGNKLLFFFLLVIFGISTLALIFLFWGGTHSGPAGIAFAFMSIPFMIVATITGLLCVPFYLSLYRNQSRVLRSLVSIILCVPALFTASIFLYYPVIIPIRDSLSFFGPLNVLFIFLLAVFAIWFFFRKKK